MAVGLTSSSVTRSCARARGISASPLVADEVSLFSVGTYNKIKTTDCAPISMWTGRQRVHFRKRNIRTRVSYREHDSWNHTRPVPVDLQTFQKIRVFFMPLAFQTSPQCCMRPTPLHIRQPGGLQRNSTLWWAAVSSTESQLKIWVLWGLIQCS